MPFYAQIRLVRGGPLIGARLSVSEDRDDVGDLIADVDYFVHIDGKLVSTDPYDVPYWPHWEPIRKEVYDYLISDAAWCRRYAPHEDRANPYRPIRGDDTIY